MGMAAGYERLVLKISIPKTIAWTWPLVAVMSSSISHGLKLSVRQCLESDSYSHCDTMAAWVALYNNPKLLDKKMKCLHPSDI